MRFSWISGLHARKCEHHLWGCALCSLVRPSSALGGKHFYLFFLIYFFFPLFLCKKNTCPWTGQTLQGNGGIIASCTREYLPRCTYSHRSPHPADRGSAVAQTAPRGNAEPLSANQSLITAVWASSPPSTLFYMQDTSVVITDPIHAGVDTTMDFFFPSQTLIYNSLTILWLALFFLKTSNFGLVQRVLCF